MVNVLATKCLDESAPANGAAVYLFDCHGRSNQNWLLVGAGTDAAGIAKYDLVNEQDRRCLDIIGLNPDSGARLQVWDCTGAWNQVFRPVLAKQ